MKSIIPILIILVMVTTTCQLNPVKQTEPTPVSIATAFPTPTSVPLNPTAAPDAPPQAGTERASPADGMIQVFVPEGTFRMGGLDVNAENDEKPDHKVTLSGFWMDKLEVTNAMYMLCVKTGACDPPMFFRSETQHQYFNNAQFNDYPVIYVGWGDAKTYCEWAGRRLPSEAEWEYAARGTDFRTYPWGDEYPDTSRANINMKVRDTTRVGSFAAGVSMFGILDLAGNVWEWVLDYYDPHYYTVTTGANPTGPASPLGINSQRRVIRGGSFQDVAVNVRVSSRGYETGPNPNANPDMPEYRGLSSPKIGFRCASSY